MTSVTSQDDAHLSLRRWAALVLGDTLAGDPWTVVTQEQAVPDESRPVAVVAAVTPCTPIEYRQTIPQGAVRLQQGFVTTVYLEMADAEGKALTPRTARRRATQVADLLLNALTVGLEADDGSALCGPFDVPLYDYSAVEIEGPERGAGPDTPYGMMDCLSSSTEPIGDPDDDRRWCVVLNTRFAWWRAGRDRAGGAPPPVTKTMPGAWVSP